MAAQASPATNTWQSLHSPERLVFEGEMVRIDIGYFSVMIADKSRNRWFLAEEGGDGNSGILDSDGFEDDPIWPLFHSARADMFRLMQRTVQRYRPNFTPSQRKLWRRALDIIREDSGDCPNQEDLKAYKLIRITEGLVKAEQAYPRTTDHLVLCTKCQQLGLQQ